MINQVVIVGRLGGDPEMRYTPNGNAVTTFSVATDRPTKEKQTDWHNIVCWNKQAEAAAEYLTKGRVVGIVGSIQYSSWDKSDGSGKGYKTEIVAHQLTFMPDGQGQRQGGGGSRSGGDQNRGPAREDDLDPDDLPF